MSGPERTERAQRIHDLMHDAVIDFIYYDRTDDEDLEVGQIEEAVAAGEIAVVDIVAEFAAQLARQLAKSMQERGLTAPADPPETAP